ncbi:MAG: PorV/PorQ family protein [Candidatus Latescibacteria bacterium]|nr:PorV/PorQ family protein [Candidatus Latescibacterota bacterium]
MPSRGGATRIGTSGAEELRIPTGARGAAMGGSVMAEVTGVEALHWNPAGVVGARKRQVAFSHLNYIADVAMNSFGATMKVKGDIALGVSAKVLNVGKIYVTTEDNPDGTGETTSPTFSVFGVTYSHQLIDRVSFGATIKYLNEWIKRETAQGMAFDFGFQYAPGFKGIRFGMTLRNFGSGIRFDGPDLDHNIRLPGADPQSRNRSTRTVLSQSELPTSLELAASFDLYNTKMNRFVWTLAFRNNNMSEDEYQTGAEYAINDMLFLRGGYARAPKAKATPSGFGKQFIFGPTFGVGVRLPVSASALAVDYSQSFNDIFTDSKFLTVRFDF